jgi:hypothetical protein
MLQTILTFRDFVKDPQEQFKMLPLQLEQCLLFKEWKKGEDGIMHTVLHVFDHSTYYIGTIEDPHWIPEK